MPSQPPTPGPAALHDVGFARQGSNRFDGSSRAVRAMRGLGRDHRGRGSGRDSTRLAWMSERARSRFAATLVAMVAIGCRHESPKPGPTKAELERKIAEVERRIEAERARAARAAVARRRRDRDGGGESGASTTRQQTHPPSPASSAKGPHVPTPFLADEPLEVGPAGPAAATPFGVVWDTPDERLLLAPLERSPRGSAPGATPVAPLSLDSAPLGLAIGPSYFRDYVYWIAHGKLVRRRAPASGAFGPLEILARDAYDATRVGVPVRAPGTTVAKIPATVAYIVRPEKEDAPLRAKLWTEGADSQLLTPEGNSAHSVSLVQTEDGVLVLSVQARMALTPVHVRRVRFPDGKPVLGDDLVAWVGGGIQPLTEMSVLRQGAHDLFGFIPQERSISEFGIARLDIGMNPSMDTKTTWTLYPNGIDPAPVAAGHLCAEPVLVYAEPETAAPDVEQELVLQSLADPSGARRQTLATAKAFYFVSVASVDHGLLVVWVTDEGTWAETVRCVASRK